MAICSQCGEDIDSLRAESKEVRFYKVELDVLKTPDKLCLRWEEYAEPQDLEDEFFCPECNRKLFDNKEEALAFLKGENPTGVK